MVAVINLVAYSFLTSSVLTCHLEDTRASDFWMHCAA